MHTQSNENTRVPWHVKIGALIFLVLLGIVLGLVTLEIAMRMNPHLVPAEVFTLPPVRRFIPSEDKSFDIKTSDGDLFYKMPGYIKPIAPADDQVLAKVHLVTDHAGFRNPDPWRANYDIVILGDSFTYVTAPIPFPERVAELTQKSVLNLGQLGLGPLEERDVFSQYGRDKSPKWVIVAFFEGNDLNDIASYAKAEPWLTQRVWRYVVNKWRGNSTPVGVIASAPLSVSASSVEYQYPFPAMIGGRMQSVALLSFYVSWLSVSAPDIAASQNLRLTREAYGTIRNESKNGGARMLIVYLPSKERLFISELRDSQSLARIFSNVSSVGLNRDGFLGLQNQPVTAEMALNHIDDKTKIIEQVARDQGADFLDLTPCFKQHIHQGESLYYEYDTHWNQAGHDLAAQLIAAYIAQGTSGCK